MGEKLSPSVVRIQGMIGSRVRRYTAEDPEAVVEGVTLSVFFFGVYLVGYDLIHVGTSSPWSLGRFGVGHIGLLNPELHIGFLILPGFFMSIAVFLFHRFRYDTRKRNEGRLLIKLVFIPIVTGAIIYLGILLFLAVYMVYSGTGTPVLVPFALIYGLLTKIADAAWMFIFLVFGMAGGYLTTRAVLFPIAKQVRTWIDAFTDY